MWSLFLTFFFSASLDADVMERSPAATWAYEDEDNILA